MSSAAQRIGVVSFGPEREAVPPKGRDEASRAVRSCFALALIWGLLWLGAWWASEKLPYIKPGGDIIYSAKVQYMQTHSIFAPGKPIKVLALGDSRVLSGFIPDQFDYEVPGVTSFNAGLPNATTFIPLLENLLAHGNVPTHVLFMFPWIDPPAAKKSIFHFLPSDKDIINTLFPFRMIVRNGVVFLLRSKRFGGPSAFYRHAEKEVAKMYNARGYYFIESQSLFADHRLPADFRLVSDNSAVVEYRDANIDTHSFRKLKNLANQHRFKILVMPSYLRQGTRGRPGVNQGMVDALRPYNEFRVLGDDYCLFDNRYFSDTAHLNPEGAQMYTSIITKLMQVELNTEQNAHAF